MTTTWLLKGLGIALIVVLALCTIKNFIWGILIFIAAITTLETISACFNFSKNKRGTRLYLWFLNQNLLLEIVAFGLGILAGGSFTLTGLNYAITTDIVALAFKWCNKEWKKLFGYTLMEYIHKESLPSDWKSEEKLLNVLGIKFPKFRAKTIK